MIALVAGLAGLLLFVLTAQDAFEVMLLPRRVLRRVRFVSVFYRLTWAGWSALASRLPAHRAREHLLGVFGALSMVLLFSIWIAGLILSFGLMLWAAETWAGISPRPVLATQLYMSGVTFFTLGLGDFVPHSGLARLVTILEAGTGLGFIAVVISYLPVLYQLFSRREAAVIRLDGRAGSPPTALGLLQRHAGEDGPSHIASLLGEWERWGSELLESHISYPMLTYYRSQHEDQSWLAALTVITDCCALVLVGIERMPTLQARMTFTMARQILVEMVSSFGVAPSRYTGGDRLDRVRFLQLAEALGKAGFDWENPDSEELLAALRATYEPLLDALAAYLVLPLPGWMPAQDSSDHWQRGPRGTLARRLLEELTAPGGAGERPVERIARWRRLRRWLNN
jgi:hypothetical protein